MFASCLSVLGKVGLKCYTDCLRIVWGHTAAWCAMKLGACCDKSPHYVRDACRKPKMKFSQYMERDLPNLKQEKPGLKAPQYKV